MKPLKRMSRLSFCPLQIRCPFDPGSVHKPVEDGTQDFAKESINHMIPGILTLVPSFLLVKKLGLLNSYWVLILFLYATKPFMQGVTTKAFKA